MDALAGSPLGWLCVGVTVLFGVAVLHLAKWSPSEQARMLVWSLLPAWLGLLCVAVLGAGGGLAMLCAAALAVALASAACRGSGAMLPVGDKAVLVTGKVPWARARAETGFSHKGDGKLCALGLCICEMRACKVSF